jgi:hypothetical protein
MPFTNIQTYLEQWLATATGGKISVAIAWNQLRMRLVCHTCQATYTSPTPTDTTIDYGVQQFVELHSHKGGYKKPTGIWEGADVVPATLDFKKIDDKPETAKRIFDTTLNYKQEMATKISDDEAFAKRIVDLQASDKGKTKTKTTITLPTLPEWGEWGVFVSDEQATDVELARVEEAASKLKAVENALKIKQLKAKIAGIQNGLAQYHAPIKNAGGEILKIAKGRKFR